MAFTNPPDSFDVRRSGMSGIHSRIFYKGKRLGMVQAISWTTQRETGTIYEMGDTKPTAIASGKEGYGGSIVLAKYHGQDLIEAFKSQFIHLWRDEAELHLTTTAKSKVTSNIEGGTISPSSTEIRTIRDGAGTRQRMGIIPWSLHQLPPVDLIIVNGNEAGWASRMYILGIKFVNSGSSSSIDDIVMSESLTYICTDIIPWQTIKADDPDYDALIEKLIK